MNDGEALRAERERLALRWCEWIVQSLEEYHSSDGGLPDPIFDDFAGLKNWEIPSGVDEEIEVSQFDDLLWVYWDGCTYDIDYRVIDKNSGRLLWFKATYGPHQPKEHSEEDKGIKWRCKLVDLPKEISEEAMSTTEMADLLMRAKLRDAAHHWKSES